MDLKGSIDFRGTLTMRVRAYLSNTLIRAAAKASRDAQAAELDAEGLAAVEAIAAAAVVSAAASLEARINEFCSDASETPDLPIRSGLDPEKVRLVGAMWDLGVPRTARFSILEKYEIASLLMGATFGKDDSKYADALLLTKLRNALVHFEPKWALAGDDAEEDLDKLGSQLKMKFEPNPFAGAGNPFFPRKCLGHGCAEWATHSAVALVDLFYHSLGVASPIDSIRAELSTRR